MKKQIILLLVLFIVGILIVMVFLRAGTWLVREDGKNKADAIVLLMGSIADRVLEAADEYGSGNVSKVIMVEESNGVLPEFKKRNLSALISTNEQARMCLVELGVPEDSIIILPGGATSTQMEAEIIRDYLYKNPEIDTILLVSSAQHLRRAAILFNAAFRYADLSVTVFCSPSNYTDYNAKKWWTNKNDFQEVILEYIKLMNFFLFEKNKLKNYRNN